MKGTCPGEKDGDKGEVVKATFRKRLFADINLHIYVNTMGSAFYKITKGCSERELPTLSAGETALRMQTRSTSIAKGIVEAHKVLKVRKDTVNRVRKASTKRALTTAAGPTAPTIAPTQSEATAPVVRLRGGIFNSRKRTPNANRRP
jgi:hypothetical protein